MRKQLTVHIKLKEPRNNGYYWHEIMFNGKETATDVKHTKGICEYYNLYPKGCEYKLMESTGL